VIGAAVRECTAVAPDEAQAAELLRQQERDQDVRLLPSATCTPEMMGRWRIDQGCHTIRTGRQPIRVNWPSSSAWRSAPRSVPAG
jgi:hypothetical protein